MPRNHRSHYRAKLASISRSFAFRVFLSVCSIAVIVVIGLTVNDRIRHGKLDASVSQLYAELRRQGVDQAKKFSECRRMQVKYSPGKKSCSVRILAQYNGISTTETAKTIEAYLSSIEATGKFIKKNSYSDSDSGAPGSKYGYATYTEKTSGLHCQSNYGRSVAVAGSWDSKAQHDLRLEFSCRDNSWFTNLTNIGL